MLDASCAPAECPTPSPAAERAARFDRRAGMCVHACHTRALIRGCVTSRLVAHATHAPTPRGRACACGVAHMPLR
eukprot:7385103-Prymnesium_polylepis.2